MEEQLLQMGFIPGPGETEAVFRARVAYCMSIRKQLPSLLEALSLQGAALLPNDPELPHWLPVIESSQGLMPWQLACTWITTIQPSPEEPEINVPLVQMSQSHWWRKIADPETLLAHEGVHAVRVAFDEPRFEEFIAAETGPSLWRRWISPLIVSPKEGWLAVLALLATFFFEAAAIFWPEELFFEAVLILQSFLLALLLAAVGRLFFRRRQLKKCFDHLIAYCGEKKKAWSLVIGLKDDEVIRFSNSSSDQISRYIEEQKKLSLRWRILVPSIGFKKV